MTTLAQLVAVVRQRTDTTSSGFVTDAELEGYLNAALAELDDLLVESSEDYKVSRATSTITSSVDGSNYFALPADFLKSRRVDRQYGSDWLPLDRFQLSERYASRCETRYRIEGAKCWIDPAGDAPGTYRLWYVPRYTALASGGSLPDHMDTQAWHEFAVCDAGAKVMQKQDLDPSIFLAQKAAQQQRVLAAAATRDAGPPRRAVDTRGAAFDGWPSGMRGRWYR